jgi:anhydro-N-acetylmuramic acid kinase
MNKNIQQLYNIALKPKRLIIGLMSGTSLDGLDVALCSIENSGLQTGLKLIHFETVPYNHQFKDEVKTIFSKRNIDLEKLTLLNPSVALQHAKIVLQCLQKWGVDKSEVDIIASHGQTIFHAPKFSHQHSMYENATLQIGDGDHLAVATGIITISDFRQKNIAAGGEGAPLAVYGDYILFSKKNQDRVLLNIGGIANFTYLPGGLNIEEIICTDIGPGNTLMDAYVQQNVADKYYDENGALALKGNIDAHLLNALKNHSFFLQPFPKTTGPELFNLDYLQNAQRITNTLHLSIENILATLNKFSADVIVAAMQTCFGSKNKLEIYVSGGGVHNPLLIQYLKNGFKNCDFFTTESLGINPDAKEAVLFAVLANECVAGDKQLFESKIKNIPAIAMGKISFPD